jgi:hypothetical protein
MAGDQLPVSLTVPPRRVIHFVDRDSFASFLRQSDCPSTLGFGSEKEGG